MATMEYCPRCGCYLTSRADCPNPQCRTPWRKMLEIVRQNEENEAQMRGGCIDHNSDEARREREAEERRIRNGELMGCVTGLAWVVLCGFAIGYLIDQLIKWLAG